MSIRSLGCFGFDEVGLVSPKKSWPNDTGIRAPKHFEKMKKILSGKNKPRERALLGSF